jgi:LysM repeat protein
MKIIITNHARFEAQRRQIDLELAQAIVENPGQKIPSQRARIVFQNRYYDKIENKEMLLRVIVAQSGDKLKVISVYKTSKIDKYWRREEG